VIRKLILTGALACVSSAVLAADAPRLWIFKAEPQAGTVHLYYGERDSSDIDLDLFCMPRTGAIRVRIFDATPRTNGGAKIRGHLSAPGGEMDLFGVGHATDETENSSIVFAPGPGLRKILEKNGTLTLSAATRQVSMPLDAQFRKTLARFTALCPIADWS
jgi:hypothetical protein